MLLLAVGPQTIWGGRGVGRGPGCLPVCYTAVQPPSMTKIWPVM
jgi:hypothetical protein